LEKTLGFTKTNISKNYNTNIEKIFLTEIIFVNINKYIEKIISKGNINSF